ncbi:MAG: hypothetical protein JST67_05555 [Bacteroidetes bacterium]|nr:hypothetical protein [Bacteroidota bacterium]
MKKIAALSAILLCAKLQAQTPEFKANYDDGFVKYKIKSYKLAITSFDKAIAIVQVEADKNIKAKTFLSSEKKYISNVFAKRAACHYYTGNMGAMQADANTVLSLDSSNADVLSLLATQKYKSGEKRKACINIQKQVAKGSAIATQVFDDCFCWIEGMKLYKEGLTAANLKRYDTALVKFQQALYILPDSGLVYAERAKVYLETNNNEKAVADIRTAISKKTSNYKVYYLRAQAFVKEEKYDSALEDMNTCLNLKKDFYEGYQLRAEIGEKQEKWNNALFDYKILIKMRPDFGMNYYKMALIKHNEQKDLLGACEMYTAAAARGVEEAKTMAANCADPKYMKKNLAKDKK